MPYTETASQFFDRIGNSLDPLTSVGGVVSFEIDGDNGGEWLIDLEAGQMLPLGAKPPKVIVKARERDFMAVVEGRMSPSDGMLTERLHVSGDAAYFNRLVNALEVLQTALA